MNGDKWPFVTTVSSYQVMHKVTQFFVQITTKACMTHSQLQYIVITRGIPIGKIVVGKIMSNYSIFC